MPKIKVFVTLYNKLTNELLEKTYDGFLTQEKMVYKEDTRIVTLKMNSNTITMIRREENDIITLRFIKGKKVVSKVETNGYEITFDTDTTLLERNEFDLHICYKTKIKEEIMGDYDFKLHYEVRK